MIHLIEKFENHLMEDGKSKATIISYVGDCHQFVKWLESKSLIFNGKLTRFFITNYKKYLIETKLSVNSINKKINSLHSFNSYLINEGMTEEMVVIPKKDKIKIAKGSEKKVDVFDEYEVERITFYIQNRGKVTERDRLTIMLLLYTGLRVSELVNMKIADIEFLTMQIKVVGKGEKYRTVPMKNEVVEQLREYLAGNRSKNKNHISEYVLLSQRSGHMDRDAVTKLLKKHGKQLEIHMNAHKFRHTFCTRLVEKGVNIATVAKLAGHSNIQTTHEYYVNTSTIEKQNAVELL